MYSRLSIQQVFNILAVGVSIAIALYGASYAAQTQSSAKKSTAKNNICTPNAQASQEDDVYYATCGGFF